VGSAGIVVVVVVVVGAMVVATGSGFVESGLIEGVGDEVAGAEPACGANVDCGALTTEMVWEIPADAYTSVPDWLAETTQLPADKKVTTPAEIEHTDCDWFVTEMDAAKNTLLSTDTV
jgi:hypothetical protein